MSIGHARRPRLLAVVAHPDDETFGLGSVLALATDLGAEVSVWCATRGEAGEPAHGCGIAVGEDLASVREQELREAAALLGIRHVDVGEFVDSGMTGTAGPGTLVAAPADVVTDAVAERMRTAVPDVVVTLDGSDGHRDHVRVRDATLAAAAAANVPWVYLWCLPRSLLRAWVEHEQRANPGRGHLDDEITVAGTPDEDITTIVDTSAQLTTRWAAIRAHRSQTSPYEHLSDELRHAFLATDRLQRVVPPWSGGPIERALGPLRNRSGS